MLGRTGKGMPNTALRSVVALFFAGFIAYAYNNAFMVLSPLYVIEIGGTVVDVGVQGSVFMAAAIVLRFFSGPLADRCGTQLVMVLGLSAFAVSGFLMAYCGQVWQFIALRCIQAAGLAAYFPCATAAVAALAPGDKTGFYLGLYRLVSSASLLFGPTLALALVEASGYRSSFICMGLCAGLAGCAVLSISSKRSRLYAEIDAGRRGKNALQGKDEQRQSDRNLVPRILKKAIMQSPLLIGEILGATFIAALGYGLLFGFAAPYIASVQPDINSGLYFTLIGVGGLVANPLAGWLSDRTSRTRILAILFVCMGAGIASLGFMSYGRVVLFVSGLLMGFGYFGSMTTVLAIVAARVADEARTSVLSLQQNSIDLGIACASGGFGLAIAAVGDVTAIFMFQGVIAVLLGLATLLLPHARHGDM